MSYVGNIFRPPSEAYSFILQVTVGCAHNECTFCSMFKDKKFSVKQVSEIFEDIKEAKEIYGDRVNKIFLADGDALVLSNEKLIRILEELKKNFKHARITSYASPQDLLRKSEEELKELKNEGIDMVYIGAESGSDTVLKNVKKGVTSSEIIEAIRKAESADIRTSITLISGLGGEEFSEEHAVKSGELITKSEPSYASLLTLMLDDSAPIIKDVRDGKMKLLSAEGIAVETILFLENAIPKKKCIFRSNHASNYVSLKGDLPFDNERMIDELKFAISEGAFKDEIFRGL